MRALLLSLAWWLITPVLCSAADLAANAGTNQFVWGIQGGLRFAIHPSGFRPTEPRGLIRLGYPVRESGRYDLINFIAIEPVVGGRKGFSELERSQSDGRPGKLIRVQDRSTRTAASDTNDSRIPTLPGGGEELSVRLIVEKFENGAEVAVTVSQRSDAPDEIQLTVEALPGSAAMDYCILTATMGNMARTRLLWLKDGPVSSQSLYPDYRDAAFAPHTFFGRERLRSSERGDILVALTTDEADPASVYPFPNKESWRYAGHPVTQFWKKPAGTYRDDLQAVVNGRFTYWMSRQPIPGGIAFENFELREKFLNGQQSVFGITRRTPQELGFRPKSEF